MRVRGEARGGEAASLISRRAGNARAGFRDPIPNPGRAERLRSVWKGAGDRCPGWQMNLPGATRRTAAPLRRCAEGPAYTRGDQPEWLAIYRMYEKSPGGTGVRGYGGTGVRGYDMMYRLCHCQPATALTVVMALHRHPFNPLLLIVARSPKDVKRRFRPSAILGDQVVVAIGCTGCVAANRWECWDVSSRITATHEGASCETI